MKNKVFALPLAAGLWCMACATTEVGPVEEADHPPLPPLFNEGFEALLSDPEAYYAIRELITGMQPPPLIAMGPSLTDASLPFMLEAMQNALETKEDQAWASEATGESGAVRVQSFDSKTKCVVLLTTSILASGEELVMEADACPGEDGSIRLQ